MLAKFFSLGCKLVFSVVLLFGIIFSLTIHALSWLLELAKDVYNLVLCLFVHLFQLKTPFKSRHLLIKPPSLHKLGGHSKGSVWPLAPLVRKKKKTLVLDLDETLVHSTFTKTSQFDHRILFPSKGDSNIPCICYVRVRPYLDLFLSRMSELYEVVVFTASAQRYADPIIDAIDTNGFIQRRFFRESCTKHGTDIVKDLATVKIDLSKVILVDNAPMSFKLYPDNAVPVPSWFHDMNDECLLDLIPFLTALHSLHDVRSVLSLRNQTCGQQAAQSGTPTPRPGLAGSRDPALNA